MSVSAFSLQFMAGPRVSAILPLTSSFSIAMVARCRQEVPWKQRARLHLACLGMPEREGFVHVCPLGRGHSTSCKFSRWALLQVLLLCGLSERPGARLLKCRPYCNCNVFLGILPEACCELPIEGSATLTSDTFRCEALTVGSPRLVQGVATWAFVKAGVGSSDLSLPPSVHTLALEDSAFHSIRNHVQMYHAMLERSTEYCDTQHLHT